MNMRRKSYLKRIDKAFKVHPIVAILGPRQCGKTTIAREHAKEYDYLPEENYFDLEDIYDLERLKNPRENLSRLKGLIVIDEIQRMPDLFLTLRVLVDKPQLDQRFLILGSASLDLIKQSSETLTGRIHYIELTPFNLIETQNANQLWVRGGYPRSYLADDDEDSILWRKSYIQTFIEQDIPNLGIEVPAQQLRRFWMMLVHYHGNTFNASEIGRSLNLSSKTIQRYTDILTDTLMIRQLQPWYENISKRQVKSRKIYFRDSGLFHTLLGAESKSEIFTHPKLGASWEGFALEEIIRFLQVDPFDCYFWATHAEAELDLLIFKNGKRLGFEFKYSDVPKLSKSMKIVYKDLKLDELIVIHPGTKSMTMAENIRAIGLEKYLQN